jgi:hypothetical protein
MRWKNSLLYLLMALRIIISSFFILSVTSFITNKIQFVCFSNSMVKYLKCLICLEHVFKINQFPPLKFLIFLLQTKLVLMSLLL